MGKKIPKKIDKSMIRRMIKEYYNFYHFVESEKNNINVIEFDFLIKEPLQCLMEIRDNLKLEISDVELNKSVQNAIHTYRGATDTYGSSTPNELKEIEKKKVIDYFLNFDSYKKSSQLFNRICMREKI
jgi:hypothetical protein